VYSRAHPDELAALVKKFSEARVPAISYQRSLSWTVMRGLDPRIHQKKPSFLKAMDCRPAMTKASQRQ